MILSHERLRLKTGVSWNRKIEFISENVYPILKPCLHELLNYRSFDRYASVGTLNVLKIYTPVYIDAAQVVLCIPVTAFVILPRCGTIFLEAR